MSEWISATTGEPAITTSPLRTETGKPHEANAVVGNGGLELTIRHGKGTLTGGGGFEVKNAADETYRGSVMATAATEGGGIIVNRAVRSNDRVTLPEGITTSAAVAASMGFLVRNHDGTFSDVPSKSVLKDPTEASMPGKPDASPEGSTDDAQDGFTIGDEGEAAMTAIIDSVGDGVATLAMDEVLQLGEVSERTLNRMAVQAGVEPAEIAAQINAAHQGFHEAATARMAARGVTEEDAFMAFLGDNPQVAGKMFEGARSLVRGSTGGIDEVADAFLEQADRYMPDAVKDALEDAGSQWQQGDNGRLFVVTEDGMRVPFNVAVRQQVIRFSR